MGKQTERNMKKKAAAAADDVSAQDQQQQTSGLRHRFSSLRNSVGEYTEIYTEKIRSEWTEKTSKIVESELYRETLSPKFHTAKEYTEEQLQLILEKAIELAKAAASKSKEVYSEKFVPYWNETVVPAASQKWMEVKEYSKEKLVPAAKEYAQIVYVKGSEIAIQMKEKVIVMSRDLFEAAKASATGVAMEKYYSEKVQPKMTELKEKATEKVEEVKQKGAELKEKATEKAEELKEKSTPYVEQATEKYNLAKEKAMELKEKSAPYYESAKEKAMELKEKSQPYIEDAKEKMTEKLTPYVEQIKEKGEELKLKASDKAMELKEKASEKVSPYVEQVNEKVELVKQNEYFIKAQEGYEVVKEKSAPYVEDLKTKSKETAEKTVESVKANENFQKMVAFILQLIASLRLFLGMQTMQAAAQ